MSNSKPAEQAMDPFRLARHVLNTLGRDDLKRRTLRFYRSEWWRWTDGRYVALPHDEFRAIVTQAIKRFVDTAPLVDTYGRAFPVTGSVVTNTMSALAALALVPGCVEQPSWLDVEPPPGQFVALGNGILNLDRAVVDGLNALRSHTPEWFSSVRLPYDFDPDASCPAFLRFINQILEGDAERIALVQEWAGLLLAPDTSFHRMLFLEGPGRNGKSVLLDVLTEMLGPANVSNVPLELFGERFQLTPTLGKLANISTETENAHLAEGILKQFVAGDAMQFDRKGKPQVQAKPTARVICSTNNRPQISDRSNGLWSRMELVPFTYVIPEHERDRHLSDKLKTEISGIFCWALEGRRRLYTNNRFTASRVCQEWLNRYREQSNTEREFLLNHCEPAADAHVAKDDLYVEYRSWAEARGCKRIMDASQLALEVKRTFPDIADSRPVIDGKRRRVYTGLQLITSKEPILLDLPIAA